LLNYACDTYRPTGVGYAVVVEPLHDRTILLEVEAVELVLEMVAVLGVDVADEVDVLVGVEGGELLLRGVVLVDLRELEVLNDATRTIVSKCWSSSYLRTISSVIATRNGFIGCAKA
jgi:hypothetical protein